MVLKFDFATAFNSIHRDKVLAAACEHRQTCSSIYVHYSYGALSFLAFGDHRLFSEEGVQHGDPLGPLLFCLAILPIMKRLSSPLNLRYLDSGTLGGSPSQVLADFELIQSEGIHIGLQVNAGKCEVVDLNGCCDMACHVLRMSSKLTSPISHF